MEKRGKVSGVAIQATETIYLGLPKTGFFLNEGWNHVAELYPVPFGLDLKYINQSPFELITDDPF